MFFANLFKELVPQADVYHEAGERSRLINIFTHAHLSGFLPIEAPLWAWKRAIAPDLINCKQEIYIDSNNHLYAFLPLKPDLYPNLHIVHLIRDPREYVRSHINWARHRFKSFIANFFTPFWQPNAWLLKEMSWKKWTFLNQFQRFSWIWQYKNQRISQLSDSGIPYMRIYFEDFFENPDPQKHLERLLNFLNLKTPIGIEDHFKRPMNPAKGKSFPKWQRWSEIQCQQLHSFCGESMKKYGYGNEEDWINKIQTSSKGGF
jgi:hypothetical protein